jgi:hypothetical protein
MNVQTSRHYEKAINNLFCIYIYSSRLSALSFGHHLGCNVFLLAMERAVRQLRGIFPPVFGEVCRGFKPLIKTRRLLHCCSKLSVVATRA